MAASAPIYDMLSGFTTDPDNADSVSTSPFWIIAIIPLAYPLSFSRSTLSSTSSFPADGALVRGPTQIITGDCIGLHISGSKASHTKTLNASLLQSDHNYLAEVLPGDWMMAWIVNNEDDATKAGGLLDRISAGGLACNKWEHGLKFVGRVESVRKALVRDRNAGKISATYSLQGRSFTELDNTIFYDHNLAEFAQTQVGTWMSKIGLDLRELFHQTTNGEGSATLDDNVHILIPSLIEILLGAGLPSTINPGGKGVLQAATGSLAPSGEGEDPKEAPFAYLVPKEVGDLLGKTSRSPSKASGILAYADLMDMIFGVQTFENTNPDSSTYSKFAPTIETDAQTNSQHKFTGKKMLGAFLPLMPELTNTPFWSVLEQFLNPAVNEMYTCMRVNSDGNVVPTLMLRQIPFTTSAFNSLIENVRIDVTPFLSLPRWKMSPILLSSFNVGRSNATRVNFVHIYGQNSYEKGFSIISQLVKNPPIRDDLDIQRSGLHMYQTTVACDAVNQAGLAPTVWMSLVADRVMGSQFTLQGTMSCVGIADPICEGDNLEFDGTVYHIETVDHACSLDPESGSRSFNTQLSLSNGLRSDTVVTKIPGPTASGGSSPPPAPNTASNSDLSLYSGIDEEDNRGYDPRTNTDSFTNTSSGTVGGKEAVSGANTESENSKAEGPDPGAVAPVDI